MNGVSSSSTNLTVQNAWQNLTWLVYVSVSAAFVESPLSSFVNSKLKNQSVDKFSINKVCEEQSVISSGVTQGRSKILKY